MATSTTEEATTETRRATRAERVSLSSITHQNIGTLRKLNTVLFPIKYSDRFYKDVLLPELEDFCKLIYYNDIPVGTICCRLEKPQGAPNGECKLYLMTMGVLAPYRSRSLGSKALTQILEAAASPSSSALAPPVTVSNSAGGAAGAANAPSSGAPPKYTKITHIYAHVQVSNTDARRFYERHGFKEVAVVEGYYKKIEPKDAWVLQREVGLEVNGKQ